MSSRQAENILAGRKACDAGVRQELKKEIATLNDVAVEDVYLFPMGMNAIFSLYEAVTAMRGTKTVQFGFPYLDTLKIQQKFGRGALYVPYNKPEDFDALEQCVKEGGVAAVFAEVPGNPLLRTPDMVRLRSLLRAHGVPLIIDDTVGTCVNVDVKPYADVVVTSLTKFFSGIGDAAGGAAVLNRESSHYAFFKEQLAAVEDLLYPDDARVLLENGRGFETRVRDISRNAKDVVAYLRNHPAVDHVYYPEGDPCYEALLRKGGGYGGLLSFTLKDESRAPAVYDNFAVAKGPGVGMDYTLAIPYTTLAHSPELDWARANGVSPSLIRVSVGREKDLLARLDVALRFAAL